MAKFTALDERFAGAPGTAWGAIAQREAALDDDILKWLRKAARPTTRFSVSGGSTAHA